MRTVTFTIPGQPQAKGRARIVKIAGFARMATPAKTLAYEGLIATLAQQAMIAAGSAEPLLGPCCIEIDAAYTAPASWSKKRTERVLSGLERPTTKPDADNVLKAVCDGINGIVWRDDVQAVDCRITKRYGTTPGVTVRVQEVQP